MGNNPLAEIEESDSQREVNAECDDGNVPSVSPHEHCECYSEVRTKLVACQKKNSRLRKTVENLRKELLQQNEKIRVLYRSIISILRIK